MSIVRLPLRFRVKSGSLVKGCPTPGILSSKSPPLGNCLPKLYSPFTSVVVWKYKSSTVLSMPSRPSWTSSTTTPSSFVSTSMMPSPSSSSIMSSVPEVKTPSPLRSSATVVESSSITPSLSLSNQIVPCTRRLS